MTAIAIFGLTTITFGQTCWQQVSSITDPYLRIVKHSNNHFLVAAGNTTGAGSPSTNSIYESNDLTNWNPISVTLASPAGLAFNIDNIGNLFLATGHAGVYTSSDTGISWSYANVGSGFGCMALDFEKDSLNNLYAGIGGFLRGLNVSTDSGASWTNQIGGKDFSDIEVINSINQVYASNTNNEIFYSSDNGNNWTQIIGQPFSNNSIMIKHINSEIYVFSNNGNIYKSDNAGSSWALYSTIPISGTATPYANDAVFPNTNIWWVGIYQNGIWRSDNNGITWVQSDSCVIGDFHYLFNEGSTLLATTSTGIFKYQECNLNLQSQPQSLTINLNNNAQFIAGASDSNATYQWQTNGVNLGWQNIPINSTYSGVTTNTLTVNNVQLANHNQPFRVIASSGNCVDTSNISVLTISNTCTSNVTIYDTVTVNVYDTLTTNVYDTLTTNITIFDTVTVNEIIYDTITTNETIYDTLTTNITIYDTLTTNIYDTTYVTVSDTLLTTVTDTLIINTTLSLPAPNNENTILIYPNPASDHITIDNGNFTAMAGYSIKITNNAGQEVFLNAINQQQFYVDLSTWTGNGLYFVHLIDSQNNTVTVRKIVLQ